MILALRIDRIPPLLSDLHLLLNGWLDLKLPHLARRRALGAPDHRRIDRLADRALRHDGFLPGQRRPALAHLSVKLGLFLKLLLMLLQPLFLDLCNNFVAERIRLKNANELVDIHLLDILD